MKKLLLLISVMLFAFGTAFAQSSPTVDMFEVSEPEIFYDQSSSSVTFEWTISLASTSGAEWSDFVGQEAQVWFNETLAAPNTVIQGDGQVVSKTFTNAVVGTAIAYRLVFACGTSEKYIGAAIDIDEGTYTPQASGPEPDTETWYIAGDGEGKDYWVCGKNWDPAGCELTDNGDGTYQYTTTVEAGTYNFKITNGAWWVSDENPTGINYGYSNIDADASTPGYKDGGENDVQFTVADQAEIVITLIPDAEENSRLILQSNIDFGEEVINRYTLTGSIPFLAGGGDWNFYADNDLIQSQENENWWIKVYDGFRVTEEQAGMEYEYKIGANGGYDVDRFPSNGNMIFIMPGEAGVYNFEFIWNSVGSRYVQTTAEDVTPKGPDALYIRGDGLSGGWMDNTTDPALMNENYLATTPDNLMYVWDWRDDPVSLVGSFKFGRLQTEDEVSAGTAWGDIVNGAYGAGLVSEISELGKYEITTPGGNFSIADALLVSRIELDLRAMAVNFIYEESTAINETSDVAVTAANGRISAEGDFTIVNLAGQDVTAQNGNLQGVYIVVVGDQAVKINVQ